MGENIVEALKIDPTDDLAWLAFADWLEECNQPAAGELHRLALSLRRLHPDPRGTAENRLRQVLTSGVRPIVPMESVGMGKGVELKLALIPPGSFLMGSSSREPGRDKNEGPVHRVTLTHGVYMGIYPVTQAQWQRVMGTNPSSFKGDDRPVENLSWEDCQLFCRKMTNGNRRLFRLPTEAEWEYACRAGTTSPFSFGNTIAVKQANYNGCATYDRGKKGTYRQHTMSAGSFFPNAFGLYDMHGNVNEWCLDAYSQSYYEVSPEHDPRCFGEDGCVRVSRGGAWFDEPARCRSASRTASHRQRGQGFRVVMIKASQVA